MNLNFLPSRYKETFNKIDLYKLTEIRMRVGFNVKIVLNNKRISLKNLICEEKDIEYVLKCVTESSLYAFNDRIKEGYITTKEGVRIGLSGECVFDKNEIVTIKNINSLNVRIPHSIYGCSKQIIPYILLNGQVKNTLIISPPFLGKTTILKDLVNVLNELNSLSILIIDERGEFSNSSGENIDILSYCNKTYAFECGIRSMSPSVIITDELSGIKDWQGVETVKNSGVKIIASCHGESVFDIVNKKDYIKDIFDVFIQLKSQGLPGQISKIFDGKLNVLCEFC